MPIRKLVLSFLFALFLNSTGANAQDVNPNPSTNVPIPTTLTHNQTSSTLPSIKTVMMNLIDSTGAQKPIGKITLENTDHGMLITPELTGLTPGIHGFHVHQNADCGAKEKDGQMKAGEAAGAHLAEQSGLVANAHKGPYADGHTGDLPALYADKDGKVAQKVLAPRLRVADTLGHSLMIHAGGDTYSDTPELGGGGERVGCGIVPK